MPVESPQSGPAAQTAASGPSGRQLVVVATGKRHPWGGSMTGSPTVIRGSNDAFTAFFRGTDGRLYTTWQPAAGTNWQGPVGLATNVSITDSPTASEPSLKLFEA